ncbi:MAG TPA: 4Fe-4S dicluster domain-containing protein [Terriglobales bacterium]|nr:4Fe-4S dicluster domain-containing protein [Terriglobales bacterium]
MLSKLKETLLCLRPGKVTLPYPAQAQPTPENFRGVPRWNGDKCIGCAGCASNCSARAILVTDICQEIRVLNYIGNRCTYCGRCAEVCPEKAITMSRDFEQATNDVADLRQRLELFMSTCQRCGRCFKISDVLEQLKMPGYRFDDFEQARWVCRSRSFFEGDPLVDDIRIELD